MKKKTYKKKSVKPVKKLKKLGKKATKYKAKY